MTQVPMLLTKSLTPQELEEHRARVGLRLEIVARKFDKFGWDKMDKGVRTMLRIDWMNALENYSLAEIDQAIRLWTLDNPSKCPNEGHIKGLIVSARQSAMHSVPEPKTEREPPATKEQAAEILKDAGYRVNKFGGVS